MDIVLIRLEFTVLFKIIFIFVRAVVGSGKTAAFLIPMIERLREHSTVVSWNQCVTPTHGLITSTNK